MSQPADTKAAEAPAAAGAAPPKASPLGAIVKFIVPAILAAGASFGAARAVTGHPPPPPPAAHAETATPGPTVPLDAFLVTISDAKGKGHAMKVSLAVEFEHAQKEEGIKPFMPRIRDAILAHVRELSYEDAVDASYVEKLRAEMLERCHEAGAAGAVRVLITDFVVQ